MNEARFSLMNLTAWLIIWLFCLPKLSMVALRSLMKDESNSKNFSNAFESSMSLKEMLAVFNKKLSGQWKNHKANIISVQLT